MNLVNARWVVPVIRDVTRGVLGARCHFNLNVCSLLHANNATFVQATDSEGGKFININGLHHERTENEIGRNDFHRRQYKKKSIE